MSTFHLPINQLHVTIFFLSVGGIFDHKFTERCHHTGHVVKASEELPFEHNTSMRVAFTIFINMYTKL